MALPLTASDYLWCLDLLLVAKTCGDDVAALFLRCIIVAGLSTIKGRLRSRSNAYFLLLASV